MSSFFRLKKSVTAKQYAETVFSDILSCRRNISKLSISTIILSLNVNRWGCHLDNVNVSGSVANSHYEKFADGRVVCIDDEIPFEVPQGWEWARLNEVCSYIQRGKSPIYSEIKRYPVVAQKCNQWSGFSIDKAQFIAPDTVGKYTEERLLQENDLLWNSTGLGTLGRMAVYSGFKNPYGWAVADSHVTVIRPLQLFMNSFFLYVYFSSPTVQNVIEDKAEGSTKQKELYVDTVKTYLIPVPPYNEQNRIVAKIDAVLPRILKYGQSQDRLDKLNGELNERLRKSILQEAIQGRLVPQDLAEEPASVLLNHIQEEKQKLMKEGKLKKKDLVDSVIFRGEDNKYYENLNGKTLDISEEVPFDLPESWRWCRLGSIVHYRIGKTPPRGETAFWGPGLIPWVSISDMKEYGTIVHTKESVSPKATSLLGQISPRGTLLMSFKLTVGRTAILDIDAYHNEAIISIWPFLESNSLQPYLFYTLPFLANLGDSKDAIKGKTLNTSSINNLLIPLPPSEEQIRIVKRITDLYRHL